MEDGSSGASEGERVMIDNGWEGQETSEGDLLD